MGLIIIMLVTSFVTISLHLLQQKVKHHFQFQFVWLKKVKMWRHITLTPLSQTISTPS